MPLLDYVQPKGYQAGGLPLTDIPHDAIDSLIEESDNTLLGWATGLMSKLGIMDDPIKHATDIPALSETGKITDENLRDAFKIAQGAFSLESIGGPAKAGSLISATKEPILGAAKHTGKSFLKNMMSQLRLDKQILHSKGQVRDIKRLETTSKYKDAPQRLMEDIRAESFPLTMSDAPKAMRDELRKLKFTEEQIRHMSPEIAVPFLKERGLGKQWRYDYNKQKWLDLKTGEPRTVKPSEMERNESLMQMLTDYIKYGG